MMMQKLLLMSILIATVIIPLHTAKERSPKRGLQKTVLITIIFSIFYVFAVIYLYPRV